MSSMHVQGELMDAVGGTGESHFLRHVMTDLTLSIAQDSGWCAPTPRHTECFLGGPRAHFQYLRCVIFGLSIGTGVKGINRIHTKELQARERHNHSRQHLSRSSEF
jgi:hypothetical protein